LSSHRMMNAQPIVQASPRYQLLGELGSGGMATVYLARLRGLHDFSRLVAIKCMHPQFAKDDRFRAMFLDEARLTAKIRHPNVVSTFDVIADAGRLLNVMEYVEGVSLDELLRSLGKSDEMVPVAIASAILHDVLCGLHAAHEACDESGRALGIVHRDVSPQNVLVGRDGLGRVLDFGIAKARGQLHHSQEGEIKGKIGYMPAEQLCGEELDRTADIYAAGVMLWELLVGERLFLGAAETTLCLRVLDGAVEAPSKRAGRRLSAEIDAVTLRAMSAEPAQRFATALAMANALAKAVPPAPRLEIARWLEAHAPETLGQRVVMARLATAQERAKTRAFRASKRGSLVAISLASYFAFGSGGTASTAVSASTAHIASAPTSAPSEAPTVSAPSLPSPVTTAKVTRPLPLPRSVTRPSPDCRLPYSVDAEGQRHFKLECL
jgi:serine/threonine protein kinase